VDFGLVIAVPAGSWIHRSWLAVYHTVCFLLAILLLLLVVIVILVFLVIMDLLIASDFGS